VLRHKDVASRRWRCSGVDTRNTGTNLVNNLVMTKEQYYWNIYRPQMLRQAVAGFAKKEEPQPVSETLTVNLVWDALTVPAA